MPFEFWTIRDLSAMVLVRIVGGDRSTQRVLELLVGTRRADFFVWIGIPERDRLDGDGSLGDYFVGALTTVPLSDRISLYALVTYVHQSGTAGAHRFNRRCVGFYYWAGFLSAL